MKKQADLTIEILKSIRDEGRKTNARLDQTNASLGALREETSAGLDALREELGRRIVESEVRTSTAITELAGTVREIKRNLPRAS